MTAGWRLAGGMLAGALLALLLHPRSRPLLLTCFSQYGPSGIASRSSHLPGGYEVLPVPGDQMGASLWMQLGAERLVGRRDLTEQDLEALCKIADRASESDPDNAFWPQMAAVFYNARGDRATAIERWLKAANALRWDDYQSARLEKLSAELGAGVGSPMSWQHARAYSLRSVQMARAIQQFGRSVVLRADLQSPSGLALRFATLKNGLSLRDGSRNLLCGDSGVTLIEQASYPRRALENPSPKRILLARLALVNRLRELGFPWQSEEARRAFDSNDAWIALTGRQPAPETYDLLAYGSIATATFSSAMIAVSILGLGILGLAELLRRRSTFQVLLRAPYAQALGLAVALALFGLTRMPLVALAAVLSFGFLTFGPLHARTHPPSYFGPLFRFTLFALATLFAVMVFVFLVGLTTPAMELLPVLDAPQEFYGGQTTPLGLAGIALAFLLLVGPTWAMVLRLPTPVVVITALREFGTMVFVGSLMLAVISVPLALYLEINLSDALHKLLVNEPNYYLLQ